MTRSHDYEFDVALSFAGEDRSYVEDVAQAMGQAGVRYFLDSEHLAETWGEDLVEFFDTLFRKRAKYAVIFISRHYADKEWPRTERRSALARAVKEKGAYILPVLLDDTELEGFRPTVGHMDARRFGIDRIVEELVNKLQGRAGSPDSPIERAPRDEAETRRLLAQRPGGWEYLLLAGELHQGLEAHEEQYRDHEAHYVHRSSVRVREDEAPEYLRGEMSNVRKIVDNWSSLLNGPVLAKAIGEPGEAGDADRIRHLAARMTSAYVELMEWGSHVRGLSQSDRYRRIFEIVSRFSDEPIEEYRQWVGEVVKVMDGLPAWTAQPDRQPQHIQLTLTLTISEEVMREFDAEMERLNAGLADDDLDQLG